MVTYYVKKNEIYKVTATVNCAVYDASGSVFISCDAGESVTFKSPSAKLTLSDDNAALTRAVESSGDVSGLSEHIADKGIHVTANEKANWNTAVNTTTVAIPKLEQRVDEIETTLDGVDFGLTDEESDVLDKVEPHIADTTVHVTSDERSTWNRAVNHMRELTIHERVINITELFPNSGSGDKLDRHSFDAAFTFLQQYINMFIGGSVTGGLKMKYKNEEGEFVEYMWTGEGEATDSANWIRSSSLSTDRAKLEAVSEHGDIVWDINRMFPGRGTDNGDMPDTWRGFYAIRQLRQYFRDVDVANGDTDPETGFKYSKKFMVPGLKLRHFRGVNNNYIPQQHWATYTWRGGTIDWSWNPTTHGENTTFDDFSNPSNWQYDVGEKMFDLHLDGGSTDSNGNELLHITSGERSKWDAHVDDSDVHHTIDELDTKYAPKNYGTANGILITDGEGNVTVSTIISVAELNTLNNNLTNIKTKLEDLESRLAALETA